MNASHMLLGNDIVDLSAPGVDVKIRDLRFMDRVFTEGEQTRIQANQATEDPCHALWATWTAKESAFKIVRKIDPNAVFAHRKFVVEDWQPAARCSRRYDAIGSVSHGSWRFPVGWNFGLDYIHCIAACSQLDLEDESKIDLAIEEVSRANPDRQVLRLTDREQESVYSRESEVVRLLAKRLLVKKNPGMSPEVVRRRQATGGFGPPILYDHGRLVPGSDISLTHDERFIAVAMLHSA